MKITTSNAPADPVLIHCRRCGRPLRNATSRLLRLGGHCRDGLTEHQLADALTGATT